MRADGILQIDSRAHRTQAQNREAARERLAELLQAAAKRPKTRRATKPTKASQDKRLESKTKRARIKRARQARTGDEQPGAILSPADSASDVPASRRPAARTPVHSLRRQQT
jgi:hypothetical protein